MKNKILLVEDSMEMQIIIKRLLQKHQVIIIDHANEILSVLDKEKVDLILLDIVLPGKDGFTILDEINNSRFADIPIVCLTGKDQISDKVTAYTMGADDYIVKPFDFLEFKAKIDSKLMRINRGRNLSYTIGGLRVNLSSHQIFTESEEEIPVTQTEFKLFVSLSRESGSVLSRQQLMHAVWGNEESVFDRAVDVHISGLRKKIANHGVSLKAVPGVGYKVVVDSLKKSG